MGIFLTNEEMIMNKEIMEQRIAAIDQQLQKLQADYNALIGARAECSHWLSTLVGDNPVENAVEAIEQPVAESVEHS